MQYLQRIHLLLLMHILCSTLQLKGRDGKNDTQVLHHHWLLYIFQVSVICLIYRRVIRTIISILSNSEQILQTIFSKKTSYHYIHVWLPFLPASMSITVGCLVCAGRGEEKEEMVIVQLALINRSLKLGCGVSDFEACCCDFKHFRKYVLNLYIYQYVLAAIKQKISLVIVMIFVKLSTC